ncbi:MAG: hypothetical protein ING75_16515 [Rhodocyclaceae bacterium]|nr:hypothetical protein [Rhodocyclaceae bacterium]
MKKIVLIALLLGALQTIAAGAIAQPVGGADYEPREAGRAYTVRVGEVLDVREVRLVEPAQSFGWSQPRLDSSDGCAALGATLGGIAGQSIGNGNGRILAGIAGAAIGGISGKNACKPKPRVGLELLIKLNDGKQIVVVQERDGDFFAGDKVRVIEGSRLRVARVI